MSDFLPQIIESVNGKECMYDAVSRALAKNRTIFLNGSIDEKSALSVITQMKYLSDRSTEDIILAINSKGGTVTDGMMIYDYMNSLPCDVAVVAMGLAASMGAFLLACGTPGKRYAMPSAEIMIHQPMGGVQGQATDICTAAHHIEAVKRRQASILAKVCGNREVEELLADMERDYWMTAQEALAYGLIDHIGKVDGM